MSELAFEWKPYKLPLHLTTSFTRTFGEKQPDGTVAAYDWTGVTFEMRFGLQRGAGGAPTLILDTANGDLTPGAGGAITFLFRPARLAALSPNLVYLADLVKIVGGVAQPFAQGQIATYQGVKA